jgi:hypothetical protein
VHLALAQLLASLVHRVVVALHHRGNFASHRSPIRAVGGRGVSRNLHRESFQQCLHCWLSVLRRLSQSRQQLQPQVGAADPVKGCHTPTEMMDEIGRGRMQTTLLSE